MTKIFKNCKTYIIGVKDVFSPRLFCCLNLERREIFFSAFCYPFFGVFCFENFDNGPPVQKIGNNFLAEKPNIIIKECK